MYLKDRNTFRVDALLNECHTISMKHKAFTDIVAQTTKVPEKTVAVYIRFLKAAGLLTSGARGVNAPDMTRVDLARILIALCATDRPSEAVSLTNRYCLAKAPSEMRIELGGKETDLAKEGLELEGVLTGVLGAPAAALLRIQPSLAINRNTRTAHLRLCGRTFDFKVAELSTDDDDGRGIVTIRSIESTDLLEMALPFLLEAADGTAWEELVETGEAARAVSRHIFGREDAGGDDA